MDAILSVEKLKVEYPSFVLGELNFDLHRGEIIGLIGENGAGKTTTIKAIMGIVMPSAGAVFFGIFCFFFAFFGKLVFEIIPAPVIVQLNLSYLPLSLIYYLLMRGVFL